MERGAREFMKSLVSIHDTECQIISFHGSNATGTGIIKQQNRKIYEKSCPLPRVFDKGQPPFVRRYSILRVVLSILHYSPLDDAFEVLWHLTLWFFMIQGLFFIYKTILLHTNAEILLKTTTQMAFIIKPDRLGDIRGRNRSL